MKIRHFGIFPLLLLFSWMFHLDDDEPEINYSEGTGIFLDTIGNEIQIAYELGNPSYYFCNVFTPVCNTGECMPVKVNIYWDLMGNYLRFDQPEDEILTKLDHVPFTDADYKLLNEVLLDLSDPRFEAQVKHYKGSQGDQQNQTNPAPQQVRILTKYEMVDGVTGSTLPEIKDKFVPGALYTTYTLWGLAHDQQAYMKNYTNFNLLKPVNYEYFLTSNNTQISNEVISQLQGNSSNPHAWAVVCMSLLDTGNLAIQKAAIQKLRWNDARLTKVVEGLENKFFSDSDPQIKRLILNYWNRFGIDAKSQLKLTENLVKEEALTDAIVDILEDQVLDDIRLDNIINAVPELAPENRNAYLVMLKDKKETFTRPQWKKVKKALKKY